jgi:uncharacterized protein YqgC (DUF456 family)
MATVDLLVGLAVLVGLLGIVVPVLPGSILILGGVLVWAVAHATTAGWVVFALVTTLIVAGGIVKYAVPGRGLKAVGIPGRTLVLGGLIGIVGFFVIPVVGLVVGFVLGVYLSELQRVGVDAAWPSTRAALKAAGFSLLIELAAGLLAAATWLVAAVTV